MAPLIATVQFVPAPELASQITANINVFIEALPRTRTRVQFSVLASQLVLHILYGIYEEMSEPESNYHPIVEHEILQALDLVIREMADINILNELTALGCIIAHTFFLILIV